MTRNNSLQCFGTEWRNNMWNRYDLKQYAKKRMKTNYWRMVLAALIIALITGSGVTYTYQNNSSSVRKMLSSDHKLEMDINDAKANIQDAAQNVNESISDHFENDDGPELLVFSIALIALIITSIIVAVAVALNVFLANPLQVGGARFFMVNHSQDAGIDSFGYAFKSNYKKAVLAMFLRDLYAFLWSLLFIIPGIIKAYQYRLVPYILADNPEIGANEALELSKKLMEGNKWDAFVLDLSFIGWNLLSLLTIGIVGVFYANPFELQTNAELYMALRPEKDEETSVYDNYIEMA